MKKALTLALALIGVLPLGVAHAQEPDVRNVEPVVMLLVDTSGSMERMPGGTTAALPVCSGSASGTNERNRWTTVLEALTGSWPNANYFCSAVPRNVSTEPDFNYVHPYHRPPLAVPQLNDGVLDVYLDRIRFGLMTFDNTYTFRDPPEFLNQQLFPASLFMGRLVENAGRAGEFSYGEPRPLTFPGCATTFMVDTGARNASATMGRLVSVGGPLDRTTVNQSIQSTLLNTRPYGATPTSSLLFDLQHYLRTHPDVTSADPYAACRDRFVLLLTDGQPDAEFRDARFNCDAMPGGSGCPYPRADTISSDLCRLDPVSGTCQGVVDGVFVVAFDVSDPGALASLNAIASRGGTREALLATNRTELLRRISEALDRAAPGTTTRTRPAFVTGGATFSGVASQLEFNAGFLVGNATTPWSGVLERTRYVCDASLNPQPEPPASRVRFDQVLNSRTSNRRLLTVVTPNAADMTNNLVGTQRDAVPLGATTMTGTVTGMRLTDFNATNVTPAHLNLTGTTTEQTARRNYIVDWVHARTPDRVNNRLGDIYHSSPVAVGPPRVDIADESYNLFRRRPEVATRPTIVYVGTNDGVLHAFVAEDWRHPTTGATLQAGHELWGFVPPVLVPKLDSAVSSRQIMVDGTAVVRDIFYRRLPTDPPSGDLYRTVLVMGFREGGPGYFALDVTDPFNPDFLWQYVGEQPRSSGGGAGRRVTPLGRSYGRPAIGQVLVDIGGVLQERAIALLPGGAGSENEDLRRTTGPVGCPAQGIGTPPNNEGVLNARSRQRCWDNTGRVLTWVDVVTGEVIQAFDETVFNAPLTGGVALYPGDIGSVAQRAFFTDADGVMWAVDFSRRRPSEWSVRPFHDIFWDAGATLGQPAYDPPVISVDTQGNIVVAVATGDIDNLTSPLPNRVVSITERRTFSSTGVPSYTGDVNWELRLRPGEQVTGQLELFEGSLYFATFESASDPSNLCQMGQSRIWGVDYRQRGGSAPTGYNNVIGRFPLPRFETTAGTGVFDRHFTGPYLNQIVLGVGVTQRPTCTEGAEEPDPYIGTRFRVTNVGGGTFQLSAQVSGAARTGTGGAVSTISMQLPAPESFTTMTGFAGRVDN
jgi:type IV pilus assembly protein PilY1